MLVTKSRASDIILNWLEYLVAVFLFCGSLGSRLPFWFCMLEWGICSGITRCALPLRFTHVCIHIRAISHMRIAITAHVKSRCVAVVLCRSLSEPEWGPTNANVVACLKANFFNNLCNGWIMIQNCNECLWARFVHFANIVIADGR